MRCLYCGKELALLKRWTGGGEFCSDAHRQQYQEEYNKLALNRLLQSQPPAEAKSKPAATEKTAEAKTPEPKKERAKAPPAAKAPEPVRETVVERAPAELPELKPASRYEERPEPVRAVALEPPPQEQPREEKAPAEAAGFFFEMPQPTAAETPSLAHPDYGFEHIFQPVLPARNGEDRGMELVPAGHVEWAPYARVAEYPLRQTERKLEVRDFVRGAPVAEFALKPGGETGLMDICEEPMEILIFPHPPQEAAPLWQEPDCAFPFEAELGALAQVPFGTTGMEDEPAKPVKASPAAVFAEPVRAEKPAVAEAKTVFVEPAPLQAPAMAPVIAPAAVVDVPPQAKPDPMPELITKPLPITLHGLAAGRGKPVQVFPSAATAGIDLQVPRSSALPLRATMTLGPASPVEDKKPEEKKVDRSVVTKTDPKRGNGRPDPRFANGKGRKPDVRVTEPEKPEEKVAVAATAKERPAEKIIEKEAAAAEVKAEPKPDTKIEPKVEQKPEPKVEQKPAAAVAKESVKETLAKEVAKESTKPQLDFPKPLAPAYNPPDLGLPSLSIDSSNSFWSRLPLAAKAGAALLVVAGIVGIVMFNGKGKGVSAGSAGQVVEAGSPLTVVDAGWITDWGAEPGVRRVHEISVLRPSLALSDYRVEFQAQIETKSIGWVYRAKDGKNFYVNRLEVVKPGLDPTIAFVRFAVINGEEQPRTQVPLSIPVHVDTLYKIRFDAVGDRFTTWVQDQKVDEWTDARIKIGGVGLYNERGERMSLKGGVNVVPLAIRK
ncbi:MAG: hypothetical protein LAO79_16830 [Acidobacteriia bacterium]|nr:hypothetical protein [Terriglobia bacterium]